MELTDKLYLKKQYIDPRGNLMIPGEYLYGELHEFIRDNSEYVVKADDIIITSIPLRPSTDITNITANTPDEKIQAELFNVQYSSKALIKTEEETVAPSTIKEKVVRNESKTTKTVSKLQ